MKAMFYFKIIIIACLFSQNNNHFKALAEPKMTATQLIVTRGFDVEEFDVISEHAYNLKVYRIVNPLADPKTLHPVPVVAHHGVNLDMSHMMYNSINARPRKPNPNERITLYAMENGTDDKNLYFHLSNNNYDVWLLECRGSTDRAMKRLKNSGDRSHKSYWDWSIDDLALLDLPTQIDFVLMKTKQEKVSYIAYSQSTMFMFALLSIEPEYSKKLTTFIALAPVVYGHNLRGTLWPAILSRVYGFSTSSSNPIQPLLFNKILNVVIKYMCSINMVRLTFCAGIWSAIGGRQTTNEIGGSLSDSPVREVSIKGYEQFIHNTLIEDFRMYDYKDEYKNMEEYGQTVPPRYNLSNIQLKTIVLFRGVRDFLSDPIDQIILVNRLKVPLYEDHVLETYSHLDFLISPTIVRDVNEPILRILDKLTNRNVTKVLHTLGEPNQLVKGTPLVIDLQKEKGDQIYSNSFARSSADSYGIVDKNGKFSSDFSSTPEAERANKGIQSIKSNTIREQLFGINEDDKRKFN